VKETVHNISSFRRTMTTPHVNGEKNRIVSSGAIGIFRRRDLFHSRDLLKGILYNGLAKKLLWVGTVFIAASIGTSSTSYQVTSAFFSSFLWGPLLQRKKAVWAHSPHMVCSFPPFRLEGMVSGGVNQATFPLSWYQVKSFDFIGCCPQLRQRRATPGARLAKKVRSGKAGPTPAGAKRRAHAPHAQKAR